MELGKNPVVITDLCKVYLKSAYHNDILPQWQQHYSTPSEIKFSRRARTTTAGVIYDNSINLYYPGLKEQDFANIDALMHDAFHVIVNYAGGPTYQVANTDSEMELSTSYDDERGHTLTLSSRSIYILQYLGEDIDPTITEPTDDGGYWLLENGDRAMFENSDLAITENP